MEQCCGMVTGAENTCTPGLTASTELVALLHADVILSDNDIVPFDVPFTHIGCSSDKVSPHQTRWEKPPASFTCWNANVTQGLGRTCSTTSLPHPCDRAACLPFRSWVPFRVIVIHVGKALCHLSGAPSSIHHHSCLGSVGAVCKPRFW